MSRILKAETFVTCAADIIQSDETSQILKQFFKHTERVAGSLDGVMAASSVNAASFSNSMLKGGVDVNHLVAGHVVSDYEDLHGNGYWSRLSVLSRLFGAEKYGRETPALENVALGESIHTEILVLLDTFSSQLVYAQSFRVTSAGADMTNTMLQTLPNTSEGILNAARYCRNLLNNPIWAIYASVQYLEQTIVEGRYENFAEMAAHQLELKHFSDEDLADGEAIGYTGVKGWLQNIGIVCNDIIALHGFMEYLNTNAGVNHEVTKEARGLLLDYIHGGYLVSVLEDAMSVYCDSMGAYEQDELITRYHSVAQQIKWIVSNTGAVMRQVMEVLELITEQTSGPAN